MTDNEIIKALECCLAKENCEAISCEKCPLEKQYECRDIMFHQTLDLINRQKTEIERLAKELMKCKLEKEMMYQVAEEIKVIAIKEFAEQLKKRFYLFNGRCVVDVPQIDNLVKEITEVEK